MCLLVCAVVVLFSALLAISVIVPPPPPPLLFGRFHYCDYCYFRLFFFLARFETIRRNTVQKESTSSGELLPDELTKGAKEFNKFKLFKWQYKRTHIYIERESVYIEGKTFVPFDTQVLCV